MRKTIIYHAKKHLSLIAWMLIISVTLLVGICVYLAIAPAKSGGPTATTKVVSPPVSVVANHYNIDYPIFYNTKVDSLLKDYASDQVAAFVNSLGKDRYDPRNRMTLEYSLLHYGSQFATVLFIQREYVVGSAVKTSNAQMTFDLKAQKKIELKDLFVSDSDAQLAIGVLLYDYLKQYAPHEFSQEQFSKLSQFTLADIQDFSFGNETLTLSVKPGVLGDKTRLVAIKRSLLDGVLKPEYGKNDKGKDIPVAASYVITERPRPANQIDPNQKMLALTFDDGPGNYTDRVLDALKRNRARGTFFVIGRQVASRAGTVKRTVNEGNEIGNHSWNHASLPLVSRDQLKHEVEDTQKVIHDVAGYTPVLMRPPYGAINPDIAAYLQTQHLQPALWNVDTEDWRYPDAQAMYDRVMQSARDGSVILLHDIHPTSVEAVERAIPELIKQGYQLVTMSQLEQYR